MASQSSFDEGSSPVETPSTPQPHGIALPVSQDIPPALSPSTSMMVGCSPEASLSLGGELSQSSAKLNSPVPKSSSMTPPPSSQAQNPRQPATPRVLRATTPTPSLLSSPPPTIINGVKREVSSGVPFTRPTHEQLSQACTEELREMLQAVIAENEKLDIAASEARMSAAHYKLQHNLLSIETEEAAKRMEVEHNMTRREVDVLQYASSPAGQEYIAKLKAYCQSVEDENVAVHQRLRKAKKVIEMKEDQLAAAKDEKQRLLQRIRENREHLNYLRSPGGIFHVATPKTSNNSYPATPQQYRATPKHTPVTSRSVRQVRDQSQEPFAALLLADRVLSQENNSAPSSPIVSRRADPRTPVSRHNRGVQSLSSLPNTPRATRPAVGNSTLLPSVQFTPQAESRTINAQAPLQQPRERRRKSRDSTISASDAEEIARAAMASYREESEEIPESQASQSAAEMLRIDPRESFEVAASRTNTPTPVAEKSGLLQAKIFGSVSKPAAEKRKRMSQEHGIEYPPKKLRAGEGVGLGIGFDPTRA